MEIKNIRNVAIIAHVDHGKTTLVDQLLRQSGMFTRGELIGDCILDSNPLERERGITILSKNCAIDYVHSDGETYHINIVDTPGHADFSGEVERVLSMADGVLLVVDAFEGVMPQTRYVLQKAFGKGLVPIVVVNKIDRQDERHEEVVDEVLDLFIELGADDASFDIPVIYASAREGWAVVDPTTIPGETIHPVFDAIINHIPVADLDPEGPLQALVTSIDYNEYVGRIGVGRVFSGSLVNPSGQLAVIDRKGVQRKERIGKLYSFDKLAKKEVNLVSTGDLFAVSGFGSVDIGDTIAAMDNPVAIASEDVDRPTLRMTFRINDGPFAGNEGHLVTSRQVSNRLYRELQSNVALHLEERGDDFIVSGRGLLHLGILLEGMRREGYELTVGKPDVIFTEVEGKKFEPVEWLVIDVPTDSVGPVMNLVGERKGDLADMRSAGSRTIMEFSIPARGLIGLRSKLLNATQGEVVMNHRFLEYQRYRGTVPLRKMGVMVATEQGMVTAYALLALADRGVMFVKPGDMVYEGMVVGEHCKEEDIICNVTKKKASNNFRASGKDHTVPLKAPREYTLEAALEYIEGDELLELTPKSIRIRKKFLNLSERRRHEKKSKSQ
jgi:GTP-binding protein